jgi:hypothetical protein
MLYTTTDTYYIWVYTLVVWIHIPTYTPTTSRIHRTYTTIVYSILYRYYT